MQNEPMLDIEKLNHVREVIAGICKGAEPEPVDTEAGHPAVNALLQEVNQLLGAFKEQAHAAHTASLEMALGVSDCFEALSQARKGNLNIRVSESTINSSDELLSKLGHYLNLTLQEMKDVIDRQRYAIRSLSTPILQIWDDVLVLPVIGILDTQRSNDIMETLLDAVVRMHARYVILDVTGVEVVDTKTADHLIKVVSSARLLGAQCVLTGIQPAVAQTLVELGIDLSTLATMRNLQDGLHECLRRRELRAASLAKSPLSQRRDAHDR